MKKVYKIRGLSCAHCKAKIEEILQQTKGIAKAKVNLKEQSIFLDYREDLLSVLQINDILREDGYEIYEITQESKEREVKPWMLLLLAGALFFLLNHLVPDLSTMLAAGNSLSVAMLFVIGITTSFHCVSMCGGIAIAHVVKDKNNGKRTMFYNLGRVISYTLR